MDLQIEMMKISDIQLPELTIVKKYINYDISKRNIDIIDEVIKYQNRYTKNRARTRLRCGNACDGR